ncbi:MAG: TlpA disulfide reductase family protein [Thermodesulfobacteriota bacterium]
MKYIFIILILISTTIFFSSCEKGESIAEDKSDKQFANNFSLQSLDGAQNVELSEFKGKPVVINFWSSWCGPCRKEMPFLENTWKEFKEKDVILIGINVMDDEGLARNFIKAFDITYLNLYDPSGKVSSKYGVVALPATFFIDREGKITKKNYGPFLGVEGEKNFIKYLKEISK